MQFAELLGMTALIALEAYFGKVQILQSVRLTTVMPAAIKGHP